MSQNTGYKLYWKVKQLADGTPTGATYTMDSNTLYNTYNGDVSTYLQALIPGLSAADANTLEAGWRTQDLSACPTCSIDVELILPTSSVYMAGSYADSYPPIPSIAHSTDKGETWSIKYSNASYSWFQNVIFPENDQVGYVTAPDKILKTTNGATSFSEVYSNSNFNPGWRAADFVNNNIGFVATTTRINGDNTKGGLLKTTNGGSSWTDISTNVDYDPPSFVYPGWRFYDIIALSANLVLAAGITITSGGDWYGTIFRSADGGSTWDRAEFDTNVNIISNIAFPETDQIGFASSATGHVYKTTDSGVNWTKIYTPSSPSTGIYASTWVDNNTGFLLQGWTSVHWKTTNGGTSWTNTGSTSVVADDGYLYEDEDDNSIKGMIVGSMGSPSLPRAGYTENGLSSTALKLSNQIPGIWRSVSYPSPTQSDEVKFNLTGVSGTAKAELKEGSTVISTKTGLNSGQHTFTSVDPGTYTVSVEEESDPTCTAVTNSITIVDDTPTVCTNGFSQVNGSTSSTITWSMTVSVAPTTTLSIRYAIFETGEIATLNNYLTISAGATTGTATDTFTRIATAKAVSFIPQSEPEYNICTTGNIMQATIPGEDLTLGRLFWTTESNNTGVWDDFTVTGGGQNEFVADGVSNYEVFTADTNAGTFVFKSGGGNFVINDELAKGNEE